MYCIVHNLYTVMYCTAMYCRGELPGLGPLTINLNINAKTNGIDVNNILTYSLCFIFNNKLLITRKSLMNLKKYIFKKNYKTVQSWLRFHRLDRPMSSIGPKVK